MSKIQCCKTHQFECYPYLMHRALNDVFTSSGLVLSSQQPASNLHRISMHALRNVWRASKQLYYETFDSASAPVCSKYPAFARLSFEAGKTDDWRFYIRSRYSSKNTKHTAKRAKYFLLYTFLEKLILF